MFILHMIMSEGRTLKLRFGRDFCSNQGGFLSERGTYLKYVTIEREVPTKSRLKSTPKGPIAQLVRVHP